MVTEDVALFIPAAAGCTFNVVGFCGRADMVTEGIAFFKQVTAYRALNIIYIGNRIGTVMVIEFSALFIPLAAVCTLNES